MSWNYRLFRWQTDPDVFFVGECYYGKKGKPELHSLIDHNIVCGDTVAETKETYKLIADAFKAPIIILDKEGNFLEGGKKND